MKDMDKYDLKMTTINKMMENPKKTCKWSINNWL